MHVERPRMALSGAIGSIATFAGVAALALVAVAATAAALAAAFLNAAFGFCLGCEVYLLGKRLAG